VKRRFLRPPATAGELVADALRLLGLASVLAAGIWWEASDAGVLALVLLGLVVPRFVGVRSWLDVASCVAVLTAGWSSVVDVYRDIAWWDLAVHLTANAAIAALGYLALVRAGALGAHGTAPRWAVVVLCTVVGLAAGAVWELLEWAGHTFVDSAIFVAYQDTISDMAIGGAGAIAIGVVLAWQREPLRPDEPDAAASHEHPEMRSA
jgi:hypothetical protein